MWNVTPADMPNGAPECRALQDRQIACRDLFYAAFNHGEAASMKSEDKHTAPNVVAAREAYEATIVELEALLGPEAHCKDVDFDLWLEFSDLYKSELGVRPRFHKTRAQVQQWLDFTYPKQAA